MAPSAGADLQFTDVSWGKCNTIIQLKFGLHWTSFLSYSAHRSSKNRLNDLSQRAKKRMCMDAYFTNTDRIHKHQIPNRLLRIQRCFRTYWATNVVLLFFLHNRRPRNIPGYVRNAWRHSDVMRNGNTLGWPRYFILFEYWHLLSRSLALSQCQTSLVFRLRLRYSTVRVSGGCKMHTYQINQKGQTRRWWLVRPITHAHTQ